MSVRVDEAEEENRKLKREVSLSRCCCEVEHVVGEHLLPFCVCVFITVACDERMKTWATFSSSSRPASLLLLFYCSIRVS